MQRMKQEPITIEIQEKLFELLAQAKDGELISIGDLIWEEQQRRHAQSCLEERKNYRPGDLVKWIYRDMIYEGRIVSCNPKSITAKSLSPMPGGKWRLGYGTFSKIEKEVKPNE